MKRVDVYGYWADGVHPSADDATRRPTIFVLELSGADGQENRLLARTQPDVFRSDGQPMVLAVEIGSGSQIKVDDRGRTMRAVQVIDQKTINPFEELLTERTRGNTS